MVIPDKVKPCGYFPFKYLKGFLEFLKENKSLIEVLTYNHLEWGNDFDADERYPVEYSNWVASLKNGSRDADKIYLILQHDVDAFPELTIEALKEEDRLEIPSNIMIFKNHINSTLLMETGRIERVKYVIDANYIEKLQDKKGFVVGYHCNAYERSGFDMEKAKVIFEEDVRSLRRNFNIQHFSPHGGARDGKGVTNNIIVIPQSLASSIRWVHNRKTIRLDGGYSDGLIGMTNEPHDKKDLRNFVKSWQRGKRYRVLIHPQFYSTCWTRLASLSGAAWYNELCDLFELDRNATGWERVKLN